MKGNTTMKNYIFRLTALILALAAAALMPGCIVINNNGGSDDYDYSEKYENASKYKTADGTVTVDGSIKKLFISWVAGSVEFSDSTTGSAELSETSDAELTDDTRMHYYFDGETLFIRYAASGRFRLDSSGKKLTVKLPAGAHFDEIKISTVSSNVDAYKLDAEKFVYKTVSGSLSCPGITCKIFSANTVSGSLSCGLPDKTDKIDIDSVSGTVGLTAEDATEIDINTTSGNANVGCANAPEKLEFDSISASLKLDLPYDVGFDARLKTVSGSLSTDFAVKVTDSHYVCGDGALKIEAKTTSGSVNITSACKNDVR